MFPERCDKIIFGLFACRCGCRRILSCGYPPDAEEGYKDALRQAGIPQTEKARLQRDDFTWAIKPGNSTRNPDQAKI